MHSRTRNALFLIIVLSTLLAYSFAASAPFAPPLTQAAIAQVSATPPAAAYPIEETKQQVYLSVLVRLPQSTATVSGTARGYLITPQELRSIKQKADQGREPYAANVRGLLNHSTMASPSTWIDETTMSGTPYCSDGSQTDASGNPLPKGPQYLIEGSRLTYAKALTANLKGTSGAAYARDARARLLEMVDTTNWGGSDYSTENQCILYLGWYISGFVAAADLLESFPQVWTPSDRQTFQRWLATQIYPKVAWASRARVNNWGSGGSYAAAVIADYVWDSGLQLTEVAPQARTLSPGRAYAEHTEEQLSRMSTTVTPRDESSSRCLPYKGIQPGGGIPDELRRASISNALSMCRATHLPAITGDYASAYGYQIAHLEPVVGHAELALRRGDPRLYDNIAADKSGSILRAIEFIIANPSNPAASYDWDVNRKGMLYIAYRYYRDPDIRARLQGDAIRSGHTVSYGRLTHGFADGESPARPPTVEPPRP